jgi:hypothetical protein
LFLNDIYFSAIDAAQLLFSTNLDRNSGRATYRAACAIDFVAKVMFYDTFVVRDTEGYGMGVMYFPWFAPRGSATSRNDVLAGKDAVRVRSCWGGMAAFDADAIQRYSSPESSELAVRFRHDPEPFWEAAECCLLFADLEQSSTKSTGVFVNPFVRVAYSQRTWEWLGFYKRYERASKNLQWLVSTIGYPEYNPRRLHNPGQRVTQKVWKSGDSTSPFGGYYELVEREAAPGGFCGQRRMFVMKQNLTEANRKAEKNWEKIPVP